MSKLLKIMCVHGLGDHRNSTWRTDWPEDIGAVFPGHPDLELEYNFITYDDIFENTDISFGETMGAVWKLGRSGVSSVFRKRRGILSDISEKLRWTAGYVVAWVEDDGFQKKTRKRILDAVRDYQPDVILAHSLGSLITYNAFSHPDAAADDDIRKALARVKYVTFGSQIGNPFVVKNLTPGKVLPLGVKFWYHLYNKHDGVFTAPVKIWEAENFRQYDTPFDFSGIGADHYASGYFQHPVTVDSLWRPLAETTVNTRSFGPRKLSRAAKAKTKRPKKRRALLIGINEYPNEPDRLEGCVNDVFLMSSVLQECGFAPEEIRTCLDHRATAEGILERMEWLVDDPAAGDERIFYFSGHGARIPTYGANGEPDHHTETLVPWNFDWSPETCITDDQIYAFYSQLPYEMQLIMIFDCCHSGGIHRDGGATIRGITPPDDIRHRELKWDRQTEMWVARDFQRINEKFARKKDDDLEAQFFGNAGTTERLGRASMLRSISYTQYDKLKTRYPIVGPYLPLIIEACREDQYAYEYRHGVTSYGAFTYSLANILRREQNITFEDLVKKTDEQLQDLQYDQVPSILGPFVVRQALVPWS